MNSLPNTSRREVLCMNGIWNYVGFAKLVLRPHWELLQDCCRALQGVIHLLGDLKIEVASGLGVSRLRIKVYRCGIGAIALFCAPGSK